MSATVDMTGRRCGRLKVTGQAGSDRHGNMRFHCLCDCGTATTVSGLSLRRGLTRSCGCLLRERARELARTLARKHRKVGPENHAWRHGHATGVSGRTPTFVSWMSMRQRCTDPHASRYPWYGGRGITVCARWHASFEAFLSDMGERPAGMTLDRIDNDGHYEPGNCRWATPKEQRANQRPRTRRAAA